MNSFSLEEERSDSSYSRKINLSFTDKAIDKVAPVLGGHVPFSPPTPPKPVTQPQQQPTLPSSQTLVDSEQSTQADLMDKSAAKTVAKYNSHSSDFSPFDYFEKDGEFLVSKNPDYKGKNKKLQQQRFSTLYVWAYFLINEEPVLQDRLTKAAQRNGIYDSNYNRNVKEAASCFFVKLDDGFKLNPAGFTEVKKIQLEIKDSDLSGLEYWNSTQKKSNRSSRITKEDMQKIEQWLHQLSSFGEFDLRTLNSAYEFAILALYDITKEIKVANAVKPSTAYEYLTKRYEPVPVKKKSFVDALSEKRYEKYFERTPEGLYFLTKEAENLAESWIT
ncbi:hypothetical protein [Lusitaniella coriacea]|uniref:hypothetical protein n=1 Tax=Lusitaniella coriacea TaxID=1983105 RepID=UPI003CEB4919